MMFYPGPVFLRRADSDDMISYDSGAATNNLLLSTAAPTKGQSVNFGTATIHNSRNYAIGVDVAQSKCSFSFIDDLRKFHSQVPLLKEPRAMIKTIYLNLNEWNITVYKISSCCIAISITCPCNVHPLQPYCTGRYRGVHFSYFCFKI